MYELKTTSETCAQTFSIKNELKENNKVLIKNFKDDKNNNIYYLIHLKILRFGIH